MADLNLIPNPMVLLVQGCVFGANYFAINNLIVKPYLRVRERREAMTVGSKDEAVKALADCEALTQRLEARLIEATTKAKKDRDVVRDGANKSRETIVAAATLEAKKLTEIVERDIKQDLAAEKLKIPQIVASLTNEVYKQALA